MVHGLCCAMCLVKISVVVCLVLCWALASEGVLYHILCYKRGEGVT
jgi:hypothetical protein